MAGPVKLAALGPGKDAPLGPDAGGGGNCDEGGAGKDVGGTAAGRPGTRLAFGSVWGTGTVGGPNTGRKVVGIGGWPGNAG